MSSEIGTFVIERTLNASTEDVWKAITNKDEMKKWYFDLAEFKPEVGFKFQFEGTGNDGQIYIHLCEITEVVLNKKLTYSWQYQGLEGISFVTFEIEEESDKTSLKLTHKGLETFPANNPDFAIESFAKGWTMIIGTNLINNLEKA